jgi:hypothetical protein
MLSSSLYILKSLSLSFFPSLSHHPHACCGSISRTLEWLLASSSIALPIASMTIEITLEELASSRQKGYLNDLQSEQWSD